MLKISNEIKSIDIDIQLTDQQRGILRSIVKSEGFDILQKIMEDQVKFYNVQLINTDPKDGNAVVVNHHLANAVGGFYVSFMKRIMEECELEEFNNRVKQPDDTNVLQDY
jgi:hypothetical protein